MTTRPAAKPFGLLAALLASSALLLGASSASAAGFGIASLTGGARDSSSGPVSQAGSHPYLFDTDISFNTVTNPTGNPAQLPAEDPREIDAVLPPGLLGNPTAAPACEAVDFVNSSCPPDSMIGFADVITGDQSTHLNAPIYNLLPDHGAAAKFGFTPILPIVIEAGLSKTPPYTAVVRAVDVTQASPLYEADLKFWGVPADPAHDAQRGGPFTGPAVPFLSLPTSCPGNPLRLAIDAISWPGSTDSAFLDSPAAGGCDQLHFDPTLTAHPTTNLADAPSGLDVDLAVPQDNDPTHNATAHLRDTTVTLPEGLVVNPASANGLEACSPAQVGLTSAPGDPPDFNADPVSCPDASKLGTVEVDTPLLGHPLKDDADGGRAAVYLAKPFDNPFNSLLALYIVLDDPASGTLVKLAGEVAADPDTGQLTTTFQDSPQVPFDHFKLHFKSGAHAPLRTPATCGDYQSTSSLTPWSAPASGDPATPSETWSISGAPGGACANSPAELPNSPSFDAGTQSPISHNFSPFVLHLRRDDGTQSFKAITLSTPPGFTARLAGTEQCSEAALAAAGAKSGAAEQASPSCPPGSRVGTVGAAVGAGPDPYNAPGAAYLSGPYKGAPVSMAIISPALAGPFDLGTVVVRVALHVDPTTAQIKAVSDPLPQILDGISLDIRSADVSLDRSQFTLTGTSCDPAQVAGALTSSLDQIAALSVPYQLSDCARLGFKPQFKLALAGGTKRNGHPALTTTIAYPSGDYANLSYAQLTLPSGVQLDQSHIQAPCTRPQFAAGQCPAASIIGTATATSPLLDAPLSGPVYLRTGNNPLPDVVLALKGPPSQPIEIDQVGKVDTVKAHLRTTFETIPDAPLSSAVVSLAGGSKGLLVNNSDLCAKPAVAGLKLAAHNNKTSLTHPVVKVAGCKKAKKHKGKKHHKKHRRHHRGSRR